MKLRKTYHIGNLRLKSPFFLAPMLEPNDIAFRLLCKKAGSSLNFTGMISPLSKKKLYLEDSPAVQIFSKDGKGIREFIKKYDKKVRLWDFNLGCPSNLAKEKGFGSYLNNLNEIEKILKEMKEATKKPITIKLRKSEQTLEIIKIANKYCDAICIHPRTKEQGYSGQADSKFAKGIKKQTNLPLIYSGDVNEKNAQEIAKQFDFVMIGRSAIGNPNIFAKLTKNKQKEIPFPFKDYLKLAKKYKIKFAQIKYQAMNFTKRKENARDMRRKLIFVKTIKEIKRIYSLPRET